MDRVVYIHMVSPGDWGLFQELPSSGSVYKQVVVPEDMPDRTVHELGGRIASELTRYGFTEEGLGLIPDTFEGKRVNSGGFADPEYYGLNPS